MNLAKLEQFNKHQFRKMLGLYAAEQRLKSSSNTFFQKINKNALNPNILESFESGNLGLDQSLFQTLVDLYQLNQEEILNISRLTQVEFIFDVFRESRGI